MYSSRVTRDWVLMQTAHTFSQRSTCSRRQVGCVIALDGRILATGYNGAPAGMTHCEHMSTGQIPEPTGCKVSVHAEANAIAFAARHGVAIEGAAVFTTMGPCLPCSQLLVNSGIVRVVMAIEHHRPMEREGISLLQRAGIPVDILRS